jgi:hypothetical protein
MNPFDELRAEIDAVRAGRSLRRARYDAGLKNKILQLLSSYSDSHITRELGLGGATLRKWQKRDFGPRRRMNTGDQPGKAVDNGCIMITRAMMPAEAKKIDRQPAAIFVLGAARIEVFESDLAKDFFVHVAGSGRS